MSELANFEVSVEKCLLAMPHEIVFDIFRRLPKRTLTKISRLCSKLRDIAGDTRLWKNVYINYMPSDWETGKQGAIRFDDLYSEPWPVKVLDLRFTVIWRPVCSKIDQVVKVTHLCLTSVYTDDEIINVILAKYQCKELHLDWSYVDSQNRITGIAPETFAKQTAIEALSLAHIHRRCFLKRSANGILIERPCNKWMAPVLDRTSTGMWVERPCHQWLAPVLSNCKNLKTLNLSGIDLSNDDMLGFVVKLPTSLEKLSLRNAFPENSFFEWLARSTPNLRELELDATRVKCSSLLKLKFLEVLHVWFPDDYQDISDLNVFIEKFPALKTVHVSYIENHQKAQFEKLRNTLEPHGIIVDTQLEFMNGWPWPEYGFNHWVTFTRKSYYDYPWY